MTGLVLAVFLGTMVGLIVPAANETEVTPTAGALSNVLVGQVGVTPPAGQRLIHGLESIPGAAIYPLYEVQVLRAPRGKVPSPKVYYSNLVAVSCASMRAIGALGQCAPGARVTIRFLPIK